MCVLCGVLVQYTPVLLDISLACVLGKSISRSELYLLYSTGDRVLIYISIIILELIHVIYILRVILVI